MLDLLSSGFKNAALKLKGQTELNANNISEALDIVRKSLLDADVEYNVVKTFLENVKNKVLGNVVSTSAKSYDQKVSAGDHFIKLCHDELVAFFGGENVQLKKNESGPTVILLTGLQGAGKTTHAAKLAKLMMDKHKMRPLLVAADVYRPAARDQLKTLGEKINVPVFTIDGTQDAVAIATQGVEKARQDWRDLVIIDTAGRLAIDEPLMQELESIKSATKPHNIVLVIDAMIGQDAVQTATAFDSRLNLTGVILTKMDGDTRGGASLSVKTVTGKPILFMGTGEGVDKLEEFRPEGIASRVLGLGDVVGLVEDFSRVVNEEHAAKSAGRLMQGKFDFNDFLEMTQTISKMGPIKDVLAKTPMMGQVSSEDLDKVNDKDFVHMRAIVQSMTKSEREKPELLVGAAPGARSRVGRISRGSARPEKEVKQLIERFGQMQGMVAMMGGMFGGGGGLLSKIPGMGGLNQLANAAKMAKQMMGGGGGMGGMPFPGGMPNPFGDGMKPQFSSAELAEINRMRKKKKEEKMARIKNRKKK